MSAMVAALALLAALPVVADNIASGTSGTCSWAISADSILTFWPTDSVSGTIEYCAVKGDVYGRGTLTYPWLSKRLYIKKVEIKKGVIAPYDISTLFYGCPNCIEMDVANLDVSNVTNLTVYGVSIKPIFRSPFASCISLKKVDMTGWDISNVRTLNYLFYRCNSLTEIKGIENWDLRNATSGSVYAKELDKTFYGCSSLTSLDAIKNWDVSNMEGLTHTFDSCTSLISADAIKNWDVSKVRTLYSTFSGCSSLASLDLSNWADTVAMQYTFSGCTSLTSLNLSGWKRMSGLKEAFYNCSSLTSLNLGGCTLVGSSTSTKTFYNCKMLGAGDSVLVTPKTVTGTYLDLPYTMYDWDNNNASYTKLKGGELRLHKDPAVALSDILSGEYDTSKGVNGGLYVAAATAADEMLWCTDSLGHWTLAQVPSLAFDSVANATKLNNVGGSISNTETNPLLTIGTKLVVKNDEDKFEDYHEFSLTENFSDVQPAEVAYFTGYYFVENGTPKLRAFSGKSGGTKGQSLVLDMKYVGEPKLTEGKLYTILCGVLINEPWEAESESAPARVKKSDGTSYFTNYTAYPLAIPEEVTAIEDITSDTTPHVVKYISPAGIESDTPFDGVNLIRYSDGTIKKVLR